VSYGFLVPAESINLQILFSKTPECVSSIEPHRLCAPLRERHVRDAHVVGESYLVCDAYTSYAVRDIHISYVVCDSYVVCESYVVRDAYL